MPTSQSKVIRTMCPMSCHPTLCGMLVEVDNNGMLVQVKGDKANPDSHGFLCVRGRSASEVVNNPRRLLYPLIRDRRTPDAWRQVSWTTALDMITNRMQGVGPQRVGLWSGHGVSSTNYGTRIGGQLLKRFANFYGCQSWSGTMICWGLGAFGLGVTGILETNTKEDMGLNSDLIVLWGANLVSQPNTARHLAIARRRGASVICIDVRKSEAAERADEVYLLRPGTDTALALAMMYVIINEDLYDHSFIEQHSVGFDKLTSHIQSYTPAWAAEITGIDAQRIVHLARRYAAVRPAMIVLGGSSLHKGANSWLAGRAISCLPALSGNLGIAGGGLGPRHGSSSHGQALNSIAADEVRPAGNYIPNQMSEMIAALVDGRIKAMLLFGTNMISSFADSERLAAGLSGAELVVSYDLFMNDTARRFADVVLPSTSWLEQLGCKSTNTHLYLMPPALEAPGETRPLSWILQRLAERLNLEGFFPWQSEEGVIDAILDHPSTGYASVASLHNKGGISELQVSHVAYPDHRYPTASGRVEFFSSQAQQLGLPPLPVHEMTRSDNSYPLILTQGRTIAHFHSFYDHGQALPALAKLENQASLWLSPLDAEQRGVVDGMPIRIYNERGDMQASAHVTDQIPAGTVWMRDGWEGLNNLTSGDSVLPNAAVDIYGFSAGQSRYEALVEVAPL